MTPPRKQATPRAPKPKLRTFDLAVSRGSASIATSGVHEDDLVRYLVAMVKALREANRHVDELTPDLGTVGSSGVLDTRDDDWAHDGRRLGFHQRPR